MAGSCKIPQAFTLDLQMTQGILKECSTKKLLEGKNQIIKNTWLVGKTRQEKKSNNR